MMSQITRRNLARGGALGVAGAMTAAMAPALAQTGKLRWRMVTSWPKRLPGPGMSAERVAQRIGALSGGRLEIAVYAAGEIVPAFEVLDAVGGGVAEMGHTASFYWQGKEAAASFFTTVPFGLTPNEHVAWIDAGGGQALWDGLYAPFGVKPFMGGNTGVCMGGWFRREIKSRDDVHGLKIRSLGLGGEVYRRLGAIAQTTAPGEILVALQSGVLDAAEFVGPGSDIALGLFRFAPFYYSPGFNKPNGTGECIVSLKAWGTLDAELQAIVTHACAAEAAFALAEMERLNIEALAALTARDQCAVAHLPSRPDRRGAQGSGRCARRSRRQKSRRPQGARCLCVLSRQDRAVVAHLAAGGAGGKGRVRAQTQSVPGARRNSREPKRAQSAWRRFKSPFAAAAIQRCAAEADAFLNLRPRRHGLISIKKKAGPFEAEACYVSYRRDGYLIRSCPNNDWDAGSTTERPARFSVNDAKIRFEC